MFLSNETSERGSLHTVCEIRSVENANLWTIVIKYMTEGAFFKYEERIQDTLKVEHIIYDPFSKKARVLVPKSDFHQKMNILKVQLKKWTTLLDPEDVREFESVPEVSHIPCDDYSRYEGSYFSNRIASIMTFEVGEVIIAKEQLPKETGQETTTTSTPSEVTVPPVIVTTTKKDLEITIGRRRSFGREL